MSSFDKLWKQYRAKPKQPGCEFDDFLIEEIDRLLAFNAELIDTLSGLMLVADPEVDDRIYGGLAIRRAKSMLARHPIDQRHPQQPRSLS